MDLQQIKAIGHEYSLAILNNHENAGELIHRLVANLNVTWEGIFFGDDVLEDIFIFLHLDKDLEDPELDLNEFYAKGEMNERIIETLTDNFIEVTDPEVPISLGSRIFVRRPGRHVWIARPVWEN
jgi:hypothetical protein